MQFRKKYCQVLQGEEREMFLLPPPPEKFPNFSCPSQLNKKFHVVSRLF